MSADYRFDTFVCTCYSMEDTLCAIHVLLGLHYVKFNTWDIMNYEYMIHIQARYALGIVYIHTLLILNAI